MNIDRFFVMFGTLRQVDKYSKVTAKPCWSASYGTRTAKVDMSVNESHAKLQRAGKSLFADWDRTKESWHDENRRQFERQYVEPLRSELRTTRQALERIGVLLSRLRRDCDCS